MTEKQNFEWSKYLNSLTENQKESFSELSKITNTTQMKEKINSDLDLKKLLDDILKIGMNLF